jgi:hypothetical protein
MLEHAWMKSMWKLVAESFSNSAGIISFGVNPMSPTYIVANISEMTSSSSGAASSFTSSCAYAG